MKKIIEYSFLFLLPLLGGYFDGYSLIFRGGRFSCIQTGNLVYIGMDLANGNFDGLLLPLFLFIAFLFGLIFINIFNHFLKKYNKEKYSHLILILIMSLFLIPNYFFDKNAGIDIDIICPLLLSFNGAILIQSFVKYQVNFVPTMMTNNTKLMINYLFDGIKEKSKKLIYKSFLYLIIIIIFIFGVFLSVLLTNYINQYSIFVANLILIILFVLEFLDNKITFKKTNNI